MTAPAGSGFGDDIEAVLARIATHLKAGDVVAAAAAVQELVASCQAAEGGRLDAGEVTRLRTLLGRCTDLAASEAGKLNAALQRFSVSGRARKAYGDR